MIHLREDGKTELAQFIALDDVRDRREAVRIEREERDTVEKWPAWIVTTGVIAFCGAFWALAIWIIGALVSG